MRGLDAVQCAEDDRTQYAVIALLEIVGEAAGKVSVTERQASPTIPWRALIGMRNHLIHGYNTVDLDVVWTAITQELPPLIAALTARLAHGPDVP